MQRRTQQLTRCRRQKLCGGKLRHDGVLGHVGSEHRGEVEGEGDGHGVAGGEEGEDGERDGTRGTGAEHSSKLTVFEETEGHVRTGGC